MSTLGKDITLQQIDSDGNIYKLFPVTRADNVMSDTGKKVTEVMEENRVEAEQATLLEKTQRETADDVLQDNINMEATTREINDNTLQSNINAEAATRQSNDETLQNNIDIEASTREENDNTLQQNIDNEASIRENNDRNLQKQIDNNDKDILSLQNKDNDLDADIDDLQEQITNNKKTFEDFIATKGKINGFASLDNNGLVPSSQLPSYVDNVVEVYATYTKSSTGALSDIKLYSDAAHSEIVTGEEGKIYVNITDGEPSYTFRYSGSMFVHIDSGSLILGEITGTAYDGKKGKDLADELSAHKNNLNNPHQVTPSQLGLDLVDNTPDSEKEVAYADLAGKASQDDKGQQIDSTYIKNVFISSGSIKFVRGDGNTVANSPSLAAKDTFGFVKTNSTVEDITGLTACPIIDGVVYYRGIEGNFSEATTTMAGLMSAEDKIKLNGISAGANNYVLPTASKSLGGVKTTSDITDTAGLIACPIVGGVVYYDKVTYSLSKSGSTITLIGSDGTSSTVTDSNTTYGTATTTSNGLMSSTDKTKLNGIATGAQVNTITGIKGNAETSYRTGNVNLTPANIGAAPSSHTHSYLPLSGGTMTGTINSMSLIPKSSANYSLGDETHGYVTLCLHHGGGRGAIDILWDSRMVLFAPTAIRALNKNNVSSYIPFEGSAFNIQSSKRYKENIQSLTEEEANKILNIDVVTFDYINKDNGINQRGCIAEQVVKHIPSVVSDGVDNDGEYHDINAIDYSKFVPYLIKKVQMLDKEVKELKEV